MRKSTLIKVATQSILKNKMRTFLTMLGIVIGVTSVIAVAAIIDGLNGFIQQRVESMGSRTYFVTRMPFGSFTPLHNHSIGHVVLMVVGGLAIAAAHFVNLRLSHRARSG